MTSPTDRSMPPPMITNVIPTVITPITEAEVRIVSRLDAGEERVGGGHADDAQQHQHRDQAEVARRGRVSSSRAQRVGRRRGLARGLLRPGSARRRRARPSSSSVSAMASRDRHRGCSAMARSPPSPGRAPGSRRARRCGAVAHHPAFAHHQHPVGQAEHLGHLAGHQDHRHAGVGQPADQAVDLGCAHRRRRRGSARRAAARRSPAAASGPARPSAGCRRRACAPAGCGSGGRTSSCAVTSAAAASSASPAEEAGPGEPAQRGQRDVAVHRLGQQQALALALLRGQPHAGPDRRGHRARPQRLARARAPCPRSARRAP